MTDEQITPAMVIREAGRIVVKPAADIVAATVTELRAVLRSALDDSGINLLVIDLEQTQMVDSMGIGLLISAFNSISKSGGRLEIVNASADILSLFKTMRMHQHFRISGK